MLMSAFPFSVASSDIKMSKNPQYVKVFQQKVVRTYIIHGLSTLDNGMHIYNTWAIHT